MPAVYVVYKREGGNTLVRLRNGKWATWKNPKGSFPARRSSKANPHRRTPINRSVAIPKGVRAGERFTRGGKTFVVVSYIHPSSGKRVRFARRVKARR